jgi:hypothetical protein
MLQYIPMYVLHNKFFSVYYQQYYQQYSLAVKVH